MENGLLADCMPTDFQHATAPYDAVNDWTYDCVRWMNDIAKSNAEKQK